MYGLMRGSGDRALATTPVLYSTQFVVLKSNGWTACKILTLSKQYWVDRACGERQGKG